MSELVEFIVVLIGSFSVILILISIFFFALINKYRKNLLKKQNEALNNLIIGQDEERERLARDIHDEMGPQLAAIVFTVDSIKSNDPVTQEIVSETKAEIRKSIQDLRKISHDLMSQSLLKFGLTAAIEELIDRQPEGAIFIELDTNSSGLEYDDHIKSHLFKITQEQIYNSNKHSKANTIEIFLNIEPETRTLNYVYKDNGVGNPNFNPLEAGIGLKNIKTRVGLMNGTFEVNMDNGYYSKITLKY